MSLLGAIVPGWKVISTAVGVGFLLLVGYWVYTSFIAVPADLHEAEGKALNVACDDLVEQLRQHLRDTDRRFMVVALTEVRNDTSGKQIERTIDRKLKSDGHIKVASDGVLKAVREQAIGWALGTDSSRPSARSLLEDKGELDAVLMVELAHRRNTSTEAQLTLTATLVEWESDGTVHAAVESSKRKVVEKTFNAAGIVNFDTLEPRRPGEAEGEAPEAGEYGFGWAWWRVLVSLVAALGLPFAFLPFTDAVTRQRSNALGLVYLGVIVLVSMTPWLLMFPLTKGGGSTLAWLYGITLFAGCFAWAFRMHDAWSERR